MCMPKQRTWTNEQLIEAVKASFSIREALALMGLKPTGGNYKQFYRYIEELDIDISHFTGKVWNKKDSASYRPVVRARPIEEYLVEGCRYQSHKLRQRLIKENYFLHKCYGCENTEWQGQSIPLELEHINGVNTDNRIENLTLLCPNCHALTSTYRGKNKR